MDEPILNLVVLRVADLERSAGFYRSLGVQFAKHRHGTGPEHYAAEMGAMTFELYPLAEGAIPTVGTRVGFSVSSLDALLEALRDEHPTVGIADAKDSPWGRRAVVKDPDGHRVELVERR